jgi:hypothetical protein
MYCEAKCLLWRAHCNPIAFAIAENTRDLDEVEIRKIKQRENLVKIQL